MASFKNKNPLEFIKSFESSREVYKIYIENLKSMKTAISVGLIPLYPDLDSFKFISIKNGIHSFAYDKFEKTAFRDSEMVQLY